VRAVLEARITPGPVDPEAARRIYDAAPERFRGPALYEAAHILFAAAPDDLAARARAADRAAAVLAVLARDPSAFERLAREESACESRGAGGRLGQIATGDTVPEFEAALEALAEGETTAEPVVTRYGLHLIRLDARLPGLIPPFEAIAPRILAQIERAAWVRAARDVTAELVAQAEISGVDFPRAA
jgi:peptidyl-prolyl cis-trans isomerase C